MNEFLQNAFTLKKEKRKEIIEFLDKVSELEEVIMVLSGPYNGKAQAITRLRNVDLWIDAHLKERPYIHAFRLHVRKKMNELAVIPWPDYVYKTGNHFKR